MSSAGPIKLLGVYRSGRVVVPEETGLNTDEEDDDNEEQISVKPRWCWRRLPGDQSSRVYLSRTDEAGESYLAPATDDIVTNMAPEPSKPAPVTVDFTTKEVPESVKPTPTATATGAIMTSMVPEPSKLAAETVDIQMEVPEPNTPTAASFRLAEGGPSTSRTVPLLILVAAVLVLLVVPTDVLVPLGLCTQPNPDARPQAAMLKEEPRRLPPEEDPRTRPKCPLYSDDGRTRPKLCFV